MQRDAALQADATTMDRVRDKVRSPETRAAFDILGEEYHAEIDRRRRST